MDWVSLISMLIPIIKECLESRSEEEVKDDLRHMGPIETVRLRRTLRKAGVQNINEEVRRVRNRLQNATDNELNDIIAEAKENDMD
jgi:hypothetical protein